METVCAVLTHFSRPEVTLTCIRRLLEQTRRLEGIVIVNNNDPDDPALGLFRRTAAAFNRGVALHILQMEANLGNAGGCAAGLNYAFGTLGADYVWMLDDDSWPRPDTLEALMRLPDDAGALSPLPLVRMAMVVDPARGDELSWPLSARATHNDAEPWQHLDRRADLPPVEAIPSRGGWLGALYPRLLWETVGCPTAALFIRGEDEEYPLLARRAGFRFVTAASALLDHPSPPVPLVRIEFGGKCFFYEPGMPDGRFYYKVRNWAWLKRAALPGRPLLRLLACGAYIILALNAMLASGETSPRRLYTLLRALHNGYYGHLRPYERRGYPRTQKEETSKKTREK